MNLRTQQRYITVALFSFAILAATQAKAFTFEATDAEFERWSRFCQVSYAISGSPGARIISGAIPEAEKDKLRAVQSNYGGPWHYCASKIWLDRARSETDRRKREFALERAKANAAFTYQHVTSNPIFKTKAALLLARVMRQLDEQDSAISILLTARNETPEIAGIYSMLSLLYQDIGDNKRALQILQEGNEISNSASAEIHYFLGLLYIEQGDYSNAKIHADKAYELGYPLPGLRQKLEKVRD